MSKLLKDFSRVFHANGLYVTQAVAPFNEDYNMQELAKYNDYLFLMAYDEHNIESQPGAVSSQRWVEKATDWAAKNVPNDKIVLGMATYGYDWANGEGGTTVSFDQTMAIAQDADAKVKFDDDTYNVNFSYQNTDIKRFIKCSSPMLPPRLTSCVSVQSIILQALAYGVWELKTIVYGVSMAKICHGRVWQGCLLRS